MVVTHAYAASVRSRMRTVFGILYPTVLSSSAPITPMKSMKKGCGGGNVGRK